MIMNKAVVLTLLMVAQVSVTCPVLVHAAPDPIQIQWFFFEPAVLRVDSNEPAEFTVKLSGTPSRVQLQFANGETASLTEAGDGVWTIRIAAAQALFGYQPDDVNRNFVGFLDVFADGTRVVRMNVFINVLDQNIPTAPITPLGPTMQRSTHIVNIWNANLDVDLGLLAQVPSLTRQFYDNFPDAFDFLNLVFTLPSVQQNRSHFAVQNRVKGIGLSTFNNATHYGSGAQLQGITQFPIDTLFDLAETGAVHELGHQWINYLTLPILASGAPHWPLSSLARGIMGFSIPPSGEGGNFPFNLVPLPDGNYQLQQSEPLREFTDLDLYLMGLITPEAVDAHIVFVNQNQLNQLHNGGILLGPVQTITVDDVRFKEGPRIPDASVAQKVFRVATIIVTQARLLNDDEMAFFNHFAARGEATIPLPFSSGLAKGTTKPFWLATAGKGSLITCLQCARTVAIAIKPGSPSKRLNLKREGVIRVAILSTDTFDATQVDALSIHFGPKGAKELHGHGHLQDVNGDGQLDLLLHFRTRDTGIQCGEMSVSLMGQTLDGQAIEGSVVINTVGCQ